MEERGTPLSQTLWRLSLELSIWMVVLLMQKSFILAHVLNDVEHKQLFYDSKTTLQEIVQGEYTSEVVYVLTKEEGPDHNKTFTVEAQLEGKVIGHGQGRTKKAAEQQAAYNAIRLLKK